MENQQASRGGYRRRVIYMFAFLVSGILFALGQHLFYRKLDVTNPPDASLSALGISNAISKQQLNISIGNTLAFLAKSCLALAVASAHEQIGWKTIKENPTKVGLVDALFASRNDVISALNIRVWPSMPFATLLLLFFWLVIRYHISTVPISSQKLKFPSSQAPSSSTPYYARVPYHSVQYV
jgi:hypothetical protein